MTRPAPTSENTERSVVDVISEIKSGAVNGRNLEPETRRECVAYLSAEGLSIPEMAKVLGWNDRTIRRDLELIREQNALKVGDSFAEQMAGELVAEARNCTARIRRAIRDKDAAPADRVEGERAVFQILNDLLARLQSMGYLPSIAHKVQAELTHLVGEPMQFAQMETELAAMSDAAALAGPEAAAELARLRALAGQARLIEQLSSPSATPTPPHDEVPDDQLRENPPHGGG